MKATQRYVALTLAKEIGDGGPMAICADKVVALTTFATGVTNVHLINGVNFLVQGTVSELVQRLSHLEEPASVDKGRNKTDEEIIAKALKNKSSVFIFHNNEIGEWRYAIVLADMSEFWLNSFKTLEEARAYCESYGLPIVGLT